MIKSDKSTIYSYTITWINGIQYGIFLQLYNQIFLQRYLFNQDISYTVDMFLSIFHILGQFVGSLMLPSITKFYSKPYIVIFSFILSSLLSFSVFLFPINPLHLAFQKLIQGGLIQIQITLQPIIISAQYPKSDKNISLQFQTSILVSIFFCSLCNLLIVKYYLHYKFMLVLHSLLTAFLVVFNTKLRQVEIDEGLSDFSLFHCFKYQTIEFKKGATIAVLLGSVQQLTGLAAFDSNQYDFLQQTMNKSYHIIYIVLYFQVIDVLSMIFSQKINICKKKQYLLSILGISIINFISGTYIFLGIYSVNRFICMRSIFLFFNQLGPSGLYYFLCSELFPQKQKEIYYSISMIVKRLLSLVIIMLFRLLYSYQFLCYFFYSFVCFLELFVIKKVFKQQQKSNFDEEKIHV
ncbi:Sugar transporter family protein [Spironucleus salmonicida]|uniref:Sugar (And other) transporter family protein n=1 Tax=Spironucleus salmonicida TaxID=348837 RepID=V6LPT2_9EUKA|nr:Sugar transporter family protein [Spironucleus salmonicida]|eukprot:EST46248.1 Sugar (and other) transporter family protein [Spironucleus salmonicida]